MRAEAILGKKDAIPENDSSDPCHILIPLRAGTALPMLCQLIANKLPTQSIKLLWYRFSITLSMPDTTLSPLPTTHIITADFAVKVNTEVSDQEEGGKGAGHLMVLLVLKYYMVAVPLPCFLFRSKTLWAGNAFCHKYIQGLKQLGLSFGSSF